jgi:CRP-like cAMP-binding protein
MPRERYEAGRLRERWDETSKTYTAWDAAGAQVAQRPFTAAEEAEATALTAATTREVNRTTILDRLAENRATLRTIATAASFTNTQRDEALRALARNAVVQNRVLEAMAGRPAALDTTD